MALEVGLELQLLPTMWLNPIVAGGAGLMLEHGSLSGPWYIAGGLEFRILSNNYVRAAARRANHNNFDDTAGTAHNPHLISVSWIW